jgi:hypothetical protein
MFIHLNLRSNWLTVGNTATPLQFTAAILPAIYNIYTHAITDYTYKVVVDIGLSGFEEPNYAIQRKKTKPWHETGLLCSLCTDQLVCIVGI